MNFFQAQDNARRRTLHLTLLFGTAVVCLVVLTNLLVAAVFLWSRNYAYTAPVALTDRLAQVPPDTWLIISVGVIGIIGLASVYKYLMIRGGGRAIAESLGGRQLGYDNADLKARRLLNIVEEMAIASGVPVPPVYLIDEPSINAFAAGFSPDDAVIGINRGTLDHLSRDELQGVVAHEFSHILNGDMRLNLRLIAILHGIVFLSMIGYGILRGGVYTSGRRSSKGGAPVLLLGVGLLVIGYAGTFFGNLIKSAVSRQREYLADAAAVQFTRNPDGIAGALKKIGGLSAGSTIERPAAAEASHLFFGQVRRMFLNPLMATHPPLDRRIRAIDPGWDGNFTFSIATEASDTATGSTTAGAAGVTQFAGNSTTQAAKSQDGPGAIVHQVGRLDAESLDAARTLIASTDTVLRDAAHDSWGCRGLLYAQLLDQDRDVRARQLDVIARRAERGVPDQVSRLLPLIENLNAPQRLLLVEMAMPALKALSRAQYDRFIANLLELIKADRQISLFEWVLHRLLVKDLSPHFEGQKTPRVRHDRLDPLVEETATLLSTLARCGHEGDPAAQQRAFDTGASTLEIDLSFDPSIDPNFSRLNRAIRELRALAPLTKPLLIKACAATVLADEAVSPDEGALLHGIAAALDCPLPASIYATTGISR